MIGRLSNRPDHVQYQVEDDRRLGKAEGPRRVRACFRNGRSWRNQRLQPKPAFSRFASVRRPDLEGQQRVDLTRSLHRSAMTAICAFRPKTRALRVGLPCRASQRLGVRGDEEAACRWNIAATPTNGLPTHTPYNPARGVGNAPALEAGGSTHPSIRVRHCAASGIDPGAHGAIAVLDETATSSKCSTCRRRRKRMAGRRRMRLCWRQSLHARMLG